MFIIRREQFDVFDQAALTSFCRSVGAYLEHAHTSAVSGMNAAALERGIRHAVTRAQGYGLDADHDVLTFVVWAFVLPNGFDDDPPVKSCLSDTRIPAGDRLRNAYRVLKAGVTGNGRPTGAGRGRGAEEETP